MSPSSQGKTGNDSGVGDDPSLEDRDAFEALADEFIARRRQGETPSLDEFIARLPDRAEEIRELFPAIAAMERWKPRPTPPRQRLGGGPVRETIGEYRLIREIGRGGMGIVYEAEQAALGRRVAIKVLPALGWNDDRPMQRFLREARTTAGLRHANIVSVFAVGHEDNLHYYVMPLIVGAGLDKVILELRERKIASIDGSETFDADLRSVARTLLERSSFGLTGPPTLGSIEVRTEAIAPPRLEILQSSGPPGSHDSTARRVQGSLPARRSVNRYWEGIAEIGRQVADALQHAHDTGILHRDIKPANLILDAEGTIWVADFGLAKAMTHEDLSRTGDLVGTLRYMAPERFRGECDGRSDVYSLGLTLYELATLRPAYDLADRAELIRKIAEARPQGPREIDPSIPRDLETVILKALEPDPARRYESAGALAADLDRFVKGLPVLARRPGWFERLTRWVGRNRALATLAMLSILLALFGGYFFRLWYYAPRRPTPPRDRPFGFPGPEFPGEYGPPGPLDPPGPPPGFLDGPPGLEGPPPRFPGPRPPFR